MNWFKYFLLGGSIMWLALFSTMVYTEERNTLELVTYTYHFQRDKGYNEKNFGLIYNYKMYDIYNIGIGRYHNSEGTYSNVFGIGRTWKINKDISFNISGGLVSGYKRGTTFFILPKVTFWDRINLTLIPTKEGGINVSSNILRW